MTSRLQEKYKTEVVGHLMERFNYSSVMEVPKLEKITINIGLGEAKDNHKALEAAVEDLTIISGQKALVTQARKSIATLNFVKVKMLVLR